MYPCGFEGENVVLDKPSELTHDQCEPLSAARGATAEGLPVIITCWKATPEELKEINRTGRVWLMIMGTAMTPAVVHGVRPF